MTPRWRKTKIKRIVRKMQPSKLSKRAREALERTKAAMSK